VHFHGAITSHAKQSRQGQLATGEGAGQRVRGMLCEVVEALRRASLCFAARGFSLHAATRIDANDRAALVPPRRLKLIRYDGVLAPNASARKQIVPAPLVEATSIEPTAAVSARTRRQAPQISENNS